MLQKSRVSLSGIKLPKKRHACNKPKWDNAYLFFDHKDTVHTEFVEQGQTVNQRCYLKIFAWLLMREGVNLAWCLDLESCCCCLEVFGQKNQYWNWAFHHICQTQLHMTLDYSQNQRPLWRATYFQTLPTFRTCDNHPERYSKRISKISWAVETSTH